MTSEKIRLKISPIVADVLRQDLGTEERLKIIENPSTLEPLDHFMLIFCLMKDENPEVKGAALSAFSLLSEETLLAAACLQDSHPALLDAIARVHYNKGDVARALLENGLLSPQARSFLQRIIGQTALVPLQPDTPCETSGPGSPDDSDAALAEDSDEFRSKYQMVQTMGVAAKIKMAMTGDKEWRTILVKDSNKLVSAGVIKNPRITEAEVLALLKSSIQNDEIMRLICANREWLKNYNIRKALVDNYRTPVQTALRLLTTLNDKDIAGYAKSKNVSTVISTQARRIILNKK